MVKLFSFFLLIVVISACDGRVQLDLNSDETANITRTFMFDEEGCKHVKVFMGKQICGGTNPDGKPITRFEEDTGYSVFLDRNYKNGISIIKRPFSELAKDDIIAEYDSDTRIITLEMPISAIQNMGEDGPPNRKNRALVATEFKYGEPEIFDGHSITITVTALEILESNGVINDARTQAVFTIPSIFVIYGIGNAGYSELYIKARY